MSRTHWGMGSFYLRGRRWWIAYSVSGKQVQESSGSAQRAEAVKLLKLRLQGATEKPGKTYVGELLDLVLYDYQSNGKHLEWARTLIEVHLRPFFENVLADRLTSDKVRSYVESRRAKGRKNATINHELSLLRRGYTLGLECEPPKVTRRIKIPKLTENNVRTGFFTQEEFEAMRDNLPDYLRPVISFAYFTACRRGEILNLQWTQVDWGARMVRLEPGTTKNKDGRMIPLTAELFAALSSLKAQRDEFWPQSPWVFSRIGSKITSFRTAWDLACERTGVNRLFHDLRRTGVRNLRRSGVSEKVAMRISGHKTRSVFDRYDITDEGDLREAVQKLEVFSSGSGGAPKPK